jgi:hypothetical protein
MHFLSAPSRMSTLEFAGLAFIIIAIAIYWGRWMNELS